MPPRPTAARPPAKPVPAKRERVAAQRGIQSIEVGGALLQALAREGRPLPLKDLAAAAGMSAAKAHPYLVSFGKLQLVQQHEATGHYGLGPLAVQLGLISLQQLDPLALASARLPALAHCCGQTVAVALWGEAGATIVRVALPPTAVHVAMRHGAVMSLRGTASGRLFAALLPRAMVLPAWRAETGRARIDAEFEAALALVRSEGLARARDLAVPGASAVAAPVFDAEGRPALALTAIGLTPGFDAGGAVSAVLRDAAAELSGQLGWRAAA